LTKKSSTKIGKLEKKETGYYKINMILALNHKKSIVFARFFGRIRGREMPLDGFTE